MQYSQTKTVSVMVVDDSAVIRGMLTRILETDPGIRVVASAPNGEIALQIYTRSKCDVVILDIEMPVMNGMETLPKLLALDKNARVVMCSTLTKENAEISLRAMALGAIDYVPKPTSTSTLNNSTEFRDRLVELVKSAGGGASLPAQTAPNGIKTVAPIIAGNAATSTPVIRDDAHKSSLLTPNAPLQYRAEPPLSWRPRILAVGSSTGGPQALFEFLKPLKAIKNIPIVITQHMPPTFTKLLAQHISAQTGIDCQEAEENMPVEPGKAYLAQGGKHMLFKKNEMGHIALTLNDGPPENFCKPAVDPMLRSLIPFYGRDILVTILTGMGSDGMHGARAVVDAGGYVYAQDQKTSVVWGMPGAVATAGLCSAILPITELGAHAAKKVLP